MTTHADRLEWMFGLRNQFMNLLNEKVPNSYPKCPVDITEKESQKFLREKTLRGVEELFEALQHLKNWKDHRGDVTTDIDKDEFLEEFVDALNYFFAVLIMAGIDSDQLFKAYHAKHIKICNRLKDLSENK